MSDEFRPCDGGVESDMSDAEAQAIADAWTAKMRRDFPQPWVGDMSGRQRQAASDVAAFGPGGGSNVPVRPGE